MKICQTEKLGGTDCIEGDLLSQQNTFLVNYASNVAVLNSALTNTNNVDSKNPQYHDEL